MGPTRGRKRSGIELVKQLKTLISAHKEAIRKLRELVNDQLVNECIDQDSEEVIYGGRRRPHLTLLN
jgi:ribosome recycling factor